MKKAKIGNVILNHYASHKKADLIIKVTKQFCHTIGVYNGDDEIYVGVLYTKDVENNEMFEVIGYINIAKTVKETLEKYYKDDKEIPKIK